MTAYNPDACNTYSCCNNRTITDPIASYVVNTIALLRSMATTSVQANEVAQTLGYHNPGDGGGNLFYWSTSETTADDNGNFIKPSDVTVGRWKAVEPNFNVRKFGAFGTGYPHDDTAAINHAVTASGNAPYGAVILPQGNYYITSTILVKRTSSTTACVGIIGSGVGTTISTDADIPMITIDGVGGRMDGLKFNGFTLSSTAGSNDIGILFQDSSPIPLGTNYNAEFTVSDIDFRGCTYGIRNTRAANDAEAGMNFCLFNNLHFVGNNRPILYGIKFDKGGGGTGNVFSDMTFEGMSEACIQMGDGTVQNCGDIIFSNMQMGSAHYGIKLRAGATYGSNIQITNCQMDAAILVAVDLTGINTFIVQTEGVGVYNFTGCDYGTYNTTNFSTITLTSCGQHFTAIGDGSMSLSRSLVVPSILTGEPILGGTNNATQIGTVAKNVSASGDQGTISITSADATNRLEGKISLVTDSTSGNRRFQVYCRENNVANLPVTFSEGGAGVVIGPWTADPGAGRLAISTSSPPANAASAGVVGSIAWDAGFIYVCTATNTWKRTPVATW